MLAETHDLSNQNVIPIRREVRSNIMTNKKRGFALVYKSLKDAPFYKNLERKSLWLHLLLQAAYEACTDSFNGNVIALQRGQLLGSVRVLGEACGVSKSSAYRSMQYFKAAGMISITSVAGLSGYSLITILNYDSYQSASIESKNEQKGETLDGTLAETLGGTLQTQSPSGFKGDSETLDGTLAETLGEHTSNNINNLKNKDLKDITPSAKKSVSKTQTTNPAKQTATELDYSSWPAMPSAQVMADWIAHRKYKRATITQTVINNFGTQLTIACSNGLTVDECLSECITRNWQGMKAEWLLKDRNQRQGTNQPIRQTGFTAGDIPSCKIGRI